MRKKSASQSAFFNLRVLIGLCIALAGVFLSLAPFGVFSATAQGVLHGMTKGKIITSSTDPLVPVGFDCSTIHEKGIDKQANFRAGAIMIACGEVPGTATSATSTLGPIGHFIKKLLMPLAYGAGEVNVITGTETSPNITQSTTYTQANPEDPSQVLVAYNDTRGRNANPINIAGASYSSDGGTTFTRLTNSSGQSPFSNTFYGPVVLYNAPTDTWFTVWLDAGCGGGGIGGYKSTTPWDPSPTSWTHFCIHTGDSDDRQSGWSDNNPASPFYGRMYISWNDFTVGGNPLGALFVISSTDNGLTWTQKRQLTPNGTPFIRNVQITGDKVTGDVYIAGMDEGGGGGLANPRRNKIYRSTDGGNTWTQTYSGPTFAAPGRANCTQNPYFVCMYDPNTWRHMGWGQPAAFNHVVSLVYTQHGAGTDPGNVYYIRSTDRGMTFSAPLKLNTDATTRGQWQPNLSVSDAGTLFSVWYDERETTSCTVGDATVPCYRMWARKSNDNGVSWLDDDMFSDVVSPLPAQPDPGFGANNQGDYDYGSAVLTKHLTSWTDGRVGIAGASQQDVFTDRELLGFGAITTTPACGSTVATQPTDFVINSNDPVNPATVQATDFTVNGTPANSFLLSNGNATITFHYDSTPVVTQGAQTMQIAAGAFNRASDNAPNLAFSCTFRWDEVLLTVTTTVPAVGGTFTPATPNNYTYDVNFNEPVAPASITTAVLTVSGNSGPSVTAVSVINQDKTARFTLHMNFGGALTASIAAGAVTDAFGNPNAAFTGNYTVQGCPAADHYTIAQIAGSIVPGTVDTGNHGDDVVTTIPIPFAYGLYDQTFNNINVSSNGNAQLTTADARRSNFCLPWITHNYTILPYWDDQRTDAQSGCSAFPSGCGIFTSVSGSAPNRIFNIEWRTVYFSSTGTAANYELKLYEGQSRFDVIYGPVGLGNASATAGVQKDNSFIDQYFCNGTGAAATGGQSYTLPGCSAPEASSAVSRKDHGAAGTFDINLPLVPIDGAVGIEDRTGAVAGAHQEVITFPTPVTLTGVAVTSGTGSATFSGSGTAEVTVNLTGVTNAQRIMVTLLGVNNGTSTGDVSVPMGVLVGDTNDDGFVNSGDALQTRNRSGQATDATNFRSDVNTDGFVNSGDTTVVRSRSGTFLP